MGLVQRDGIHRLRHAKGYSRPVRHDLHGSAWTGWLAGTGRLAGPGSARDGEIRPRRHLGNQCGRDPGQRHDPCGPGAEGTWREDRGRRRLSQRDDEAGRYRALPEARHRRGARLRGHARPLPRRLCRPRLSRPLHRRAATSSKRISRRGRRNGRRRSPGSAVGEIEAFAKAVGRDQAHLFPPRLWLRAARGTVPSSMHAASCIAAVTGAWQYEGGGAFHSNGGIFGLDKTMIEGLDLRRSEGPPARPVADRRRCSAASRRRFSAGRRSRAMLIQNTNPLSVAPEQAKVKRASPATTSSSASTSR